ncbi:MAG TPA: hypothetical protein VF365_03545 [Candidatus Limnocylindria bacterium]
MTRRRWLLLVAACGVAILALSFVNAWIVHDRELRGEGYRHVQQFVSAWRGVGMPVLALGVVIAGVTAAWAVAMDRRASRPAWPLVLGAAVTLGIVAAGAVPVGQDAHASSVDLSAGPLLPVGVLLAVAMLVGAVALLRPSLKVIGAAAVVVMLALGLGAGARWLALQLGEGQGRHWSEGSYTRSATGGEPTETLTIGEGSFTVGDRWAGRWEWSGWTVVVDDDPACPDSRGTYHAHGVGDEDLRFVMVVDTCRDGARGADLQTGIWHRDP